MSYLNCPACGLSFSFPQNGLPVEHCPRCIAHRRTLIGFFVSGGPGGRRPQRAPSSESAPWPSAAERQSRNPSLRVDEETSP